MRRTDPSPLPLRARRRRARNRFLVLVCVALVSLFALVAYGLHRPEVRIQAVVAEGMHVEDIPAVAQDALSGSYFHLVPKDSIFFYPEDAVRGAVLDAFPDISSLSIGRAGLTSIRIDAMPRVEAFAWCGRTADAENLSCYEADGEGFIFAPATASVATLRIHGPLKDAERGPIGNTVEAANHVPLALQLVRSFEALGASVGSIELRGDEADLYVRGSGTRITYVLGEEARAAALAATVLPTLSLTDGSVEYLDLRFEGKAYVKRRGEAQEM